ncbi:50S ribosomal protein L24e [Candidatus Woesearchaeota archaeon]|nr:50S ribosomal protein L24e [Candidatus Woesearchaeota archaeon]
MPKCAFCGLSIERGTGKMFVYVSGKVVYFCSGKCEKNLFKLSRKPLRTKWTEAYRKEKGSSKATETVVEEASVGKKKEKK